MHQQPSRTAIDPQYRWDLTRIFSDEQRWEDAYAQLAAALPQLTALGGSLGASAAQLLHALQQRDAIAARIDRLQLERVGSALDEEVRWRPNEYEAEGFVERVRALEPIRAGQ